MRENVEQNLLYDVVNEHWLRLDISSSGFNLFFLPNNNQDNTWTQSDFPSFFTAWDPELKKTFYYFLKNENLYRYYQYPISVPEMRLSLENEPQLKAFIEPQNGFISVTDNERSAWGQKIEILNGIDWEISPYQSIKGISDNPLPQNIIPHQAAPTMSSNPWLDERNLPPNFDSFEPVQSNANEKYHWKLKMIACGHLKFKEETSSREEYLSLLEALLGKNELSDNVKENHLFERIQASRRQIRETINQLNNPEDLTKEAAGTFILECIQKEYEQISGSALSFQIDFNQLPQANTANATNQEEERGISVYQNLLYSTYNMPRLYEILIEPSENEKSIIFRDILQIFLRLEPNNNLPNNRYNHAANFLCAEKQTLENTKIFCRKTLITILYPRLNEETIIAIASLDTNKLRESHLLSGFSGLYAFLQQPYPTDLLKKPLSAYEIYLFALADVDTAMTVLETKSLLIKLNDTQIRCIAESHQTFKTHLSNLSNNNTFKITKNSNISTVKDTVRYSALTYNASAFPSPTDNQPPTAFSRDFLSVLSRSQTKKAILEVLESEKQRLERSESGIMFMIFSPHRTLQILNTWKETIKKVKLGRKRKADEVNEKPSGLTFEFLPQ